MVTRVHLASRRDGGVGPRGAAQPIPREAGTTEVHGGPQVNEQVIQVHW